MSKKIFKVVGFVSLIHGVLLAVCSFALLNCCLSGMLYGALEALIGIYIIGYSESK